MKRHLSQHPDFPVNPIKELFKPTGDSVYYWCFEVSCKVLCAVGLFPYFVIILGLSLIFDPLGVLSWLREYRHFTEPVLFVHDGMVYRAQRHRWGLVTALDRAGRSHLLPLKYCFLPEASHLPQLEAWDAHITAGV